MCNKNSTTSSPTPTLSATQTKSIMKKNKKPQQQKQQTNKASSSSSNSSSSSSSSSSSLKPLKRRNRTKTRKPKFLSLRLQLSQTQNQPKKGTHEQHQQPNNKTQQKQQQNQLNLFPLHPETDMPEENNVAFLFSSDGGGSLNGLLEDESTTLTAATSEEGSLSAMTCPALEGLVRKAMRRRRSDDGSEERWVSYSEVVEEKKEMMEEVSSATAATTSFGSLSLKLDHDGILNAWSDKGSLYVAGEEAPQTVPDLFNASFLHNHQAFPPNAAWDGCGCDAGNTWKVPENCGANSVTVKEEMGWKLGQREASVLRYKEKRRSRLFAKRIRYEVRKLNAEKRPRMKGRFVKRE